MHGGTFPSTTTTPVANYLEDSYELRDFTALFQALPDGEDILVF